MCGGPAVGRWEPRVRTYLLLRRRKCDIVWQQRAKTRWHDAETSRTVLLVRLLGLLVDGHSARKLEEGGGADEAACRRLERPLVRMNADERQHGTKKQSKRPLVLRQARRENGIVSAAADSVVQLIAWERLEAAIAMRRVSAHVVASNERLHARHVDLGAARNLARSARSEGDDPNIAHRQHEAAVRAVKVHAALRFSAA